MATKGFQVAQGATAAATSGKNRYDVDASGNAILTNSAGVAQAIGEYYLAVELTDVSTASSAWVVVPHPGVVTKVKTILHSAITVADAVLTAEINGTPITGISITVAQSGSAAGDVDTDTATAANTVAENDKLELVSDGGSTTAARLTAIFTIERR